MNMGKEKAAQQIQQISRSRPEIIHNSFQIPSVPRSLTEWKIATLKEDTDRIITEFRKALNEQVKNATQLEIALLEQELKDNHT